MNPKVIAIENRPGIPLFVLQRVMRMVPDRDKGDKRLQRLVAFRLLHDGEAATCEYLMRQIRRYVRRSAPPGFYDFILQDQGADPMPASGPDVDPLPPGAA